MTNKGFTIFELIIVVILFAMLAAAATYIFRAVFISWSSGEKRVSVDIMLARAIEEMSRDLREATAIDAENDDEIRFISDDDYIYYFYNENDSYPPDFSQDSYELRLAELDGVVGEDLSTGTLIYGDGKIILTGVLPPDDIEPPTTDLSISGGVISIALSASEKNETIRIKTGVKPRNL